MATWSAVLPLALLMAGAVPFLIESGVRLRMISAVLILMIAFATLMAFVAPELHIWTRTSQLTAAGIAIASLLWLERRRFRSERSGGLLFLHSLTFLYFMSVLNGFSDISFWLTATVTGAVAMAAFTRTAGHHAWRVLLSIWLIAVLWGLLRWQVNYAMGAGGLWELPPEVALNPMDLKQIFSAIQQVLFGGGLAFLGLSFMTAGTSAWGALKSLGPSNRTTVTGFRPTQDRRFPLPGAIAVIVLHGIPLIIFRVIHPLAPEAFVLNLALAVSPLLVTGLLRRTVWGGLREVPLQSESGLDRMRRSALHRDRASQKRVS